MTNLVTDKKCSVMTNGKTSEIKITFFPYDFSYKVEGEITYFVMFGRTSTGEKVCVKYAFEPYFFVEQSKHKNELLTILEKLVVDEDKNHARSGSSNHSDFTGSIAHAKVVRVEKVKKDLLGVEKEYLKVVVNYPKAVPILAKEIESWGIVCYERDILFVHRVMRDLGIAPGDTIVAAGIKTESNNNKNNNFNSNDIVKTYVASSLEIKDKVVAPNRILAIDIETYAVSKEIDYDKNPIIMIALYGITSDDTTNVEPANGEVQIKAVHGKEFVKVLTWKNCSPKPKYTEVCKSEKHMLERLGELISEFDPDILTGYYSDGFDLPYIKSRSDKLGLSLKWGLDGSELRVGRKSGMRNQDCSILGIVHIDVCKFVQNIFGKNLKTDSFSLDAVASELLGEKKLVVSLDELGSTWDSNINELGKYIEYNLRDAKLTWQLCSKLLFDMIEFSRIIGVPLFDVIRMRFGRLVENYILKRAVESNVLAPNKPTNDETEDRMDDSVEGAFVLEPTAGLYKDVAVFDFRSLYPSIITAHNISPESLHCEHDECKKKVVPGREKYWFCQKKKAFLSQILEDIIVKRSEIKSAIKKRKIKDTMTIMLESRSYAFKTLANSFYGYLGFYAARWYCIGCSDSTTAYARYYIGQTIDTAGVEGFKVIYADTDSCFLIRSGKSKDSALNFMKKVNKDLPGLMELELEGYYPSALFVSTKGSEKISNDGDLKEKGAKKRYALLREDGTLKITGFEVVRRNTTPMVREMQEKVLQLVLSDKVAEALAFVKKTVIELREGRVPIEKLILKTQLTRDIEKYTSVGPHVAVAQKMKDKGESVYPGMLISYVIIKGKGLIRERAVLPSDAKLGEYDVEYYLNHHLVPAVALIFSVFGYDEGEISGKATQKGLSGFF